MKAILMLAMGAVLALSPCSAMAQETRTVVDGTGTEIAVPTNPQRIVTLHDSRLTVPLLELGVVPVGSHGRVAGDGTPFIRSSLEITGFDFDNSDIAFVGETPIDAEQVAALEPDLIIAPNWEEVGIDQLRTIAPTYVFDYGAITDEFEIYQKIAELAGVEGRLATLEARYAEQIRMIRALVADPAEITVSVIQPRQGQVRVWNTYFSLGKVLRDAGFSFPAAIDAVGGAEAADFSAEVLPELDADFIFITYPLMAFGQTPADTEAAMADVLPGWCGVLHACRNGQVIYLPRSVASSTSYEALGQMAQAVASHIVGRDFVPMPD
ncbi:ABC transporter substrate-binding protein [Pelagibacterium xiamenense]|uniref:ABC transporter substrate-binding protein n=1 Tax=Pelagibacterium xiamenense TaxID=2901140 RepID=UPI001E2BBF97|nr:ABC transporter substrate-binding protein [Pelagibacterium xiamenense]MCD7058681.1 ABC transporter substrate-binding protein [Pelagibacterium xiamenense]